MRITKRVPADLPPIRIDGNQLELAILNLAVNARDAMPQGGSLTIAAEARRIGPGRGEAPTDGAPRALAPGDYVRLAFVDDGAGMDEATLARATEPFFTTKGPGKGTGLGLSMVQGLAVQSGGAMGVQSEAGRGTTIALWLPQADAAAASAPGRALPGAEPRPEPPCPPATTRLRVLLVDDDALVSSGTVAMLEDLGHDVVEANSAARALDVLRRPGEDIRIVITDHSMPGMTGLELIGRIRDAYPSVAVILASGYAEIDETVDQGDLLRLPKPFRQSELAIAIDKAMTSAAAAP